MAHTCEFNTWQVPGVPRGGVVSLTALFPQGKGNKEGLESQTSIRGFAVLLQLPIQKQQKPKESVQIRFLQQHLLLGSQSLAGQKT